MWKFGNLEFRFPHFQDFQISKFPHFQMDGVTYLIVTVTGMDVFFPSQSVRITVSW